MEPEGSIPNSQELSSCPYPEPDQSSPHNPILSLQDQSQYYPPTHVFVFLVVSFPLAFLSITGTRFTSPLIRAKCSTHRILLDLIILIIFGEEYKSQISSYAVFSTFLSHHPLRSKFSPQDPVFLFSMLDGSLSPQHVASSGCGWRDGLQLWRVAANILNKQWRANDRGRSSSGLGMRLTTSHLKNSLVTKHLTEPRAWTDYSDKRPELRN
jgi:hypothetical protein